MYASEGKIRVMINCESRKASDKSFVLCLMSVSEGGREESGGRERSAFKGAKIKSSK